MSGSDSENRTTETMSELPPAEKFVDQEISGRTSAFASHGIASAAITRDLFTGPSGTG
jgi:hypothetical protein